MVSRNYTVQSDRNSPSYHHERSPNGSYGKGIHKNGNFNNAPKRKENIYHKNHASVGTQCNSQRYKDNSSPTNSRYTYSTPHPKCKVDRVVPAAASPTYSTIDHDSYTSNNNIDLKRVTTYPEDRDIHESNISPIYNSSDVQRINCIDSHYHYTSNIPSFNSFNNNSNHSSEAYVSQGYKVRIPLTSTPQVNNGGVSNLPTIAESVVDETEYAVDVQQDYEYRPKVNRNQTKPDNINIREDAVGNGTKEECYCRDTPYGSRSERFQYLSENSRESNETPKPGKKCKYQGTHPDSLYRVAQLVGHDGTHGRCFGRTSRLRNLCRLLRWPLALVAVIVGLILLIYFLMPETEHMQMPPFNNSSADWNSQLSNGRYSTTLRPMTDNQTMKEVDTDTSYIDSMKESTTTKLPFEIIVEPEKDELNFGYPEDDVREDEGIESVIKLGPGLGLDPHIFQNIPTSPPVFPKHLSPSVQYGNEHEDAASNEKYHHQVTTEKNNDGKYFTPTYAVLVSRAAFRPTEKINESEERDNDKFIEAKPEISEPNINKALKLGSRFTSGHQNSFGIPVEDAIDIKSTTQSALYNTRVSPTLPTMVGRNAFGSTTIRSRWNTTEDGICFSTRLSMCRGVLPYDLTTVPLIGGSRLSETTPLLQLLLRSGCSSRARQFLCSLLEPECRPRGMKVLAPCRSACQDIASSCRDVIAAASSELAELFDCSQYPIEEDECAPLKDAGLVKSATCPPGELRCSVDGSCIAGHWRCDGISDCPGATDEHGCDDSTCGPNEFKCGHNGTCIPEEWVCDGHVDCLPEGFDENGCTPDEDKNADSQDVQGAASQHPRPIKLPRPARLQSASQKLDTNNNLGMKPTTEYDSSKELLMMSDSLMPVRKPLPTMRKKTTNQVSTASRVVTSTSSSISIHRSTLCAPGDPNCKRKVLSSRLTPCARGSCYERTTTSTTAALPTFNVTRKIEDMEAASGLTSHSSPCPQGELRCVDGRCITLEQLCDRHPDCSDGVDEANCFT